MFNNIVYYLNNSNNNLEYLIFLNRVIYINIFNHHYLSINIRKFNVHQLLFVIYKKTTLKK